MPKIKTPDRWVNGEKMNNTARITELKNSFRVEMFNDGVRVARNYFTKSSSAISFCFSNGYEITTLKLR